MMTPSEIFDRAGYDPEMLTDPLVTATEAACYIAGLAPKDRPNWLIVADAQQALPPRATYFERGLTAGIALMLLVISAPGGTGPIKGEDA